MIWMDIEGYEGLYQVSDTGLVKSLARLSYNGHKMIEQKEKIKSPLIKPNGYLSVILYKDNIGKRFYVHRLVCMSFIGYGGVLDVNHKDGNKQNNNVNNLEFVSRSENIKHAREIGIRKTGENHTCAKLTDEQVSLIRAKYKRYDKDYGANALALLFGVSHQLISMIANGKHRVEGVT